MAFNKTILEEEVGDFLIVPSAPPQPNLEDEAKKSRKTLICFGAMVVTGLGNKVFQKLQTIPMRNYPNFLYISTTFFYIPFSFAYIIPMIKWGSAITPDQLLVPKRVFFIMAALDGVGGIMQTLCATYLNGALLILLSQAAIPISMLISKKLLGASYTTAQYAGAFVVALGILVVLGPSLAQPEASGVATWAAVMVVSCVPVALSTVYKERALGDAELDVMYLNGWVAVYQFLLALPLAIPAALASEPPVTPEHLPENLWNGLRCFCGDDSVKDGPYADHCWPTAPIFVSLYLVLNIAYNIVMILLIKYGSANTLFLALTITVPLGNLVFALPGVPGRAPVRAADVVGLVTICAGLVLYRFKPSLPAVGRDKPMSIKERSAREPLLAPDGEGGLVELERSGAGTGEKVSSALV